MKHKIYNNTNDERQFTNQISSDNLQIKYCIYSRRVREKRDGEKGAEKKEKEIHTIIINIKKIIFLCVW